MLANWSAVIAARVGELREALLSSPSSVWTLEAARHTNGLPVYGDLGGVIILTLGGELVLYADSVVSPVTEPLWRDVALASMARRYPELRDLLLKRPAHADDCTSCCGGGWAMNGRFICGACRGRGWLVQERVSA